MFTPEQLGPYLTEKLGDPVIVDDVRQFGRGSSRETWFVTYRGKDSSERKLVFRLDFPAGPICPGPLDLEYFIYERLGRTPVPVAKVLWWEDDLRWAGRPFYAREHIDGDWNIENYLDPSPDYDDMRIAISKEHVSKLALVHTVDWKGLGFDTRLPAPKGVEDCARNYVDQVMAQYRTETAEAVPLMLEAAAWLKARAPIAPRVSLCKGTNGLGEEIFRNGRIVAMSDWEEATIGDPAADFAATQNLLPTIMRDGVQIWGIEQALDYYADICGIRIDPASVHYYRVMRGFKTMLYSLTAAASVHRMGSVAEIRQAWVGTEVCNIGKRMIAAAMDWREPISAELWAAINESVEQRK